MTPKQRRPSLLPTRWLHSSTTPKEGRQDVNHYVVKTIASAGPGAMTAQQYDAAVADLVNFMDYVAEPHKAKRIQIGIIALFLLGFLLPLPTRSKEYWNDVHWARLITGRCAHSALSPVSPARQAQACLVCLSKNLISAVRNVDKRRKRGTATKETLPMMTLYSGTTDPFQPPVPHRPARKGMDFQIIDVDLDHKPEDLA